MFTTIDEIKAANAADGQTWFAPAEMRFFRTRLSRTVYAGRYFITSEQTYSHTYGPSARCYSIREAHPDGSITTVGEFGEYDTLTEAKRAARALS